MAKKKDLPPQKTKGGRTTSVRLRIIDGSAPQNEVVASINEAASAGVEVSATTETETIKVRIRKIVIDPHRNPRIEVIGHRAGGHVSFPILTSIRLLFYLFRLLSIGHWVRVWGLSKGRRVAVSAVDWYIIAWLILELIIVGVFARGVVSPCFFLLFTFLASYRIFELIQVYFNILAFDPLQHYEAGEEYFLYSASRSVLISLISYAELIVCYGLIYNANTTSGFASNAPISNILDALYFSANLATVGYVDIVPIGWMRMVAMSEALLGVLFIVTIIAHFLNYLPSPKGGKWRR